MTFSYFCAMAEKARMQTIMMAPPMSQARTPSGISPPVFCKMTCALKNTPEPTTMPTTMQIAVKRPYFFSSLFSIAVTPYPAGIFPKSAVSKIRRGGDSGIRRVKKKPAHSGNGETIAKIIKRCFKKSNHFDALER